MSLNESEGNAVNKTSALQSVMQSMDQSAPISVDVLVILLQAQSEDLVGQFSKTAWTEGCSYQRAGFRDQSPTV